MRLACWTCAIALLLSACRNPDAQVFEDLAGDTLRVHQLIQSQARRGQFSLVPSSYHGTLSDMRDNQLADHMPLSDFRQPYTDKIKGLRHYFLQQFHWRAEPSGQEFLVFITSWPEASQAAQDLAAEQIAYEGAALTAKWEKEYDHVVYLHHDRQVAKILGNCGAECLRGPFEAIQHAFQADSAKFQPWEL
jgi:hypothetical protein